MTHALGYGSRNFSYNDHEDVAPVLRAHTKERGVSMSAWLRMAIVEKVARENTARAAQIEEARRQLKSALLMLLMLCSMLATWVTGNGDEFRKTGNSVRLVKVSAKKAGRNDEMEGVTL